MPTADALFAADRPWWKLHDRKIRELCPAIERWSCEPTTRDFGTQVWTAAPGRGLYKEGDYQIQRGSSSGFMAAQLAMKWGSKHVVLVGMDCKRSKDGKNHWFGDHPAKLLPSQQPFITWADEWDSLAAPCAERGIDIVNCTIDTAIKKIRRSTLERELFAPEERRQDHAPDHGVQPGKGNEDQQQAA